MKQKNNRGKSDDEKAQFLTEKMEQYLSFFFFYEKPYNLDSLKPFKSFLEKELLVKVKEIEETYKERDNRWILTRLKEIYQVIMHFGSMLERLQLGIPDNCDDETLKSRKNFYSINYNLTDLKNKDRRISDKALFSEYTKKFGKDDYFETELDVIRRFSEDGITLLLARLKVQYNYLIL